MILLLMRLTLALITTLWEVGADDVGSGSTMLEQVTLDESYGIGVADVGTNNDAVESGIDQNIGGGVCASLVGGGVGASLAVVDIGIHQSIGGGVGASLVGGGVGTSLAVVDVHPVVPHIRSAEEFVESTTYWHCREIRLAAIENIARFHCRNTDDVSHDEALQ